MTILAIDTCETHCSAALLLASGQDIVRSENLGRGHAERLLPMVGEILAEAKLEYSAISRIAVTTGPGTFTGLRIGLSVARGLALALDIPCVGLMSLPVIAAELGADKTQVHVVTSGRGGQVFYQSYSGVDATGLPIAVSEPINDDADIVAALIMKNMGPIGGSGVSLLAGHVPSEMCQSIPAVNPVLLGQLSEHLDPSAFPPEPTYLREADAVKAKAVFPIQAS